MPRYDYVCQSCGAEVEVLHGLNATGPAACDICGGPMRKRVSAPTIVFRGSGWAKKERHEAASARTADKDKDKDKGKDKDKDTDKSAANGKEAVAAAGNDAAGGGGGGGTAPASESKGTGDRSAPPNPTKEATAG